MTTLWIGVSIVTSANAQDGLTPDKLVPASSAIPKATFVLPLCDDEEKSKTTVMRTAQQFLHHTRSLSDMGGVIQDSSEGGRDLGMRVPNSFAKFTGSNSGAAASWSVRQPSFVGKYHVERDTIQRILVSDVSSYALMPLEVNQHVKRILDYYQHDIHQRFQRYLDRFEKYKDLVQRVFRQAGLPLELGYLSLVESGFNPRAFSRARASGPWQFMKATGRVYGLTVTWYVDERRDPVKSTVAAAHHLRDLFDEFQSWPLALGAYNAGGSRIQRAIRKSGSRDFWKIRKTGYIVRETKDYVPSFIAAVLIASNPTQYGFKLNPTVPYTYDEVLVRKRAHLKAVAETTGIPLGELKELNPELLHNIIPIVEVGYSLKVPPGKGLLVRERHDQIKMWTKLPPESATWYRVRFGETLADVAQRFGLTKQELRRLNNLNKDDRILWNDRLRLRTDDDSVPIAVEAEPSPPPTWYRVRYGDTLASIAKKFDLTKQELRRLNNLNKDDRILWNDRLRIRADEDDHPSLVPKAEPTPPPTWYRVHYGDTLASIAKKFDLTKQELRRLNNLNKDDRILWNDRLRIRADEDDDPSLVPKSEPSPPGTWYRVRYGDTLTSIAKRFGLSVQKLKRLNHLKDDRIRSNDRLRVRAGNDNSPVAFNPEKDNP